jgi:hypothetical protein
MLTEDVNCMFCHLTVNGDVGSIHALRPGFGTEEAGGPCSIAGTSCGIGSGRGSVIDGSVFVRSSITKDMAGANMANGTQITGSKNENYTGDRLPRDENGITAFPGLDRAIARTSAKGSLAGGTSIRGVAVGDTFSGASPVQKVDGHFDGNLVLVGTPANPININGDVYVSGDVVINGVVEGQGAIYAGRNVYIAGNLLNKNRADKPGAGVCQTVTSPDECARKNISAGKDELRLSAGNNIVMGNFTEKDSSGNLLPRRERQAADYFREQFGLAFPDPVLSTADRFVRKGTDEELRAINGGFLDQLGRTVPATSVQRITGNAVYENLISPGHTDQTGQFSRWLSDQEYRDMLGYEMVEYGIWRTRFRFLNGATPIQYKNTGNVTQKIDDLVAELEASGFPKNANFTRLLAKRIIENPGANQAAYLENFSGTDANGNPVSGTISFDGSYLRVAMREEHDYPTEVTQLDAFLYANSRIAGKLATRGGFVNGGLIARELGLLAPGRNGYADWLDKLSAADQAKFNLCDRTARPLDSVDDADNNLSKKTCNYAVNYDHRLRNGGYGFNLYQGTTGITADWSFDLNGSQKVDLTP